MPSGSRPSQIIGGIHNRPKEIQKKHGNSFYLTALVRSLLLGGLGVPHAIRNGCFAFLEDPEQLQKFEGY